MMVFSGEELYDMYYYFMNDQNIEITEWKDLDKEDQIAWNKIGERVTREIS